ncbi:hypothetical protein [Pseudomonas abieticivorans]|uniref:hypothetical protein n=1 Tax=Pseudomonas abieticivorans TaxID=2931382 RepID=UPI0020C10909|nr:hypothetical protein [Pseudomonas sp. PIA16]
MHHRGFKYWEWADCTLHAAAHDEKLDDGRHINVLARISRAGIHQVFIGLYNSTGLPLRENYYDDLEHDDLTQALHHGIAQARQLVTTCA